jgi:mRNA interferase RelE/StbE
VKVVNLLASNPRPAAAKPHSGGEGEWRVRTGDDRVVDQIHDQVLVVLVVAVGHSRDIHSRGFARGRGRTREGPSLSAL